MKQRLVLLLGATTLLAAFSAQNTVQKEKEPPVVEVDDPWILAHRRALSCQHAWPVEWGGPTGSLF